MSIILLIVRDAITTRMITSNTHATIAMSMNSPGYQPSTSKRESATSQIVSDATGPEMSMKQRTIMRREKTGKGMIIVREKKGMIIVSMMMIKQNFIWRSKV